MTPRDPGGGSLPRDKERHATSILTAPLKTQNMDRTDRRINNHKRIIINNMSERKTESVFQDKTRQDKTRRLALAGKYSFQIRDRNRITLL